MDQAENHPAAFYHRDRKGICAKVAKNAEGINFASYLGAKDAFGIKLGDLCVLCG